MIMEKLYFIGMDVHKDTIQMAVMTNEDNDVIENRKLAADTDHVVTIIKKYQAKGGVIAGYESGCTGYPLQRALTKIGIECKVLPAQKVAKKRDDNIKTDKRDAALIARMLKHDEVKGIHIPTLEDEAVRDLLRCREALKEDLKRGKQRLLKLLLRYDRKFTDGKSFWTLKYYKWLGKQTFDNPYVQETFDEYLSYIKTMEERVARVTKKVVEVAESDPYKERVQRLRSFKGIDFIIAMSLICEIGDFCRFGSAGALMAYLGLVPSENSSGTKRRQGSITRAGNSHLRRLLIEAAWHYARGSVPSAKLIARRQGSNKYIINQADKAIKRLYKKYGTMVLIKGKHKNVAITAIARELTGFIWDAMILVA
jgi:transposase